MRLPVVVVMQPDQYTVSGIISRTDVHFRPAHLGRGDASVAQHPGGGIQGRAGSADFEEMHGFCWKIHDPALNTQSQAGSAKAANLEHRVFPRGVSSNQAANRTRFIAAAVKTCCRRVLAMPT